MAPRQSDLKAERQPDDAGTVLLLVIAVAAVAIGLIIAMSDVTALYLGRRAVAAAADATALAGAQGADLAAIYAGKATVGLPLSSIAVRQAVTDYVSTAGLATTLRGFKVESVSTDGHSVRVVISAVVVLPFAGLISTGAGSVTVRAAARAMAPVA